MMVWLSLLIANGIIGSGIIWLFGSKVDSRQVAVLSSIIGFMIFIMLSYSMDFVTGEISLVESYAWIPFLNLNAQLGIDGISYALIGLTLVINFIIILSAYLSEYDNIAMYLGLFLWMQSMVVGVFSALDAILFYMFWEGMLIPMYLCIGIWGSENRSFASMKFFLYTFIGSLLMLIGFVYLGLKTGSFAFSEMVKYPLSLYEQQWLFLALLAAFAVKIPMFPLHTWLPDAHTEAPASGSVILAALMLKVGAYGLIRLSMPILPDACSYFAPLMIALSLISIIYVGVVAFSQIDIKRLIAYSSVAHMGFVTLGLFLIYYANDTSLANLGYTGALIQMIAHAFGSGALFFAFGMIYQQCHERKISAFSGLATQMPRYSMFFMLFVLSTIGVPLTAGFVGEWTVIISALQSIPIVGMLSALTLLLSAAYLLTLYRSVFFGKPSEMVLKLRDIGTFEIALLSLISLLIIALGVYPQVIISTIGPAVSKLTAVSLTSKLVV